MTYIFILPSFDIAKMICKDGISCHFLLQIQKILKVMISNPLEINIISKVVAWEGSVANC